MMHKRPDGKEMLRCGRQGQRPSGSVSQCTGARVTSRTRMIKPDGDEYGDSLKVESLSGESVWRRPLASRLG